MTTLSDKLNSIEACAPAVAWCRGKSEAKAWAKCKRPDWMLYILSECAGHGSASERAYRERCACAAMSACLDVVADRLLTDNQTAAELVRKVSTALDVCGQGGKRKECGVSFWDLNGSGIQGWEMWLTDHALDYLKYGNPCDLCSPDPDNWPPPPPPPRVLSEMCREIRRVAERPNLRWIK